MSNLQQITSPPQAGAEVVVNENFIALEQHAVYGKAAATSSGLVWGTLGGRWGGFAITAGTLTLTASTTNYVVVAIATGVVSTSTAGTNWADTTNYAHVYKVTTGATAVTAIEDHRAGPAGVHGGVAGGSGGGGGSYTLPISSATVLGGVKVGANLTINATTGVLDATDTVGVALSNTSQWTKNQSVAVTTLTDASTIAVDASLSNNFKVTLGGNRTLGAPSGLVDGMVLNFVLRQPGSGGPWTLSFASAYDFPGGVAPTLKTAANAVDFMSGYYDSALGKLICNFRAA